MKHLLGLTTDDVVERTFEREGQLEKAVSVAANRQSALLVSVFDICNVAAYSFSSPHWKGENNE